MTKSVISPSEKFLRAMDLLNEAMNQAVENDADCISIEPRTEHFFGGGVYCRVMHLAPGTVLTGKIHRYAGINIMLSGEMTVATVDGVRTVRAPDVFVSPPGVRRAGVAHTESTWINLHATDQTDPDCVEKEVVVTDYIDLEDPPDHLPKAGLTEVEEEVLKSLMLKSIRHSKGNDSILLLAKQYIEIGEP